MANRIGRKPVIIGGLGAVAIPVGLITLAGTGPWLFILIPIAGLFSGAAYTCIFVSAQKVVPGAMGLVSGIILSFMFSSGSIGTLFSGFIADANGFGAVFYLTAGLALIGALTALALKTENGAKVTSEEIIREYSQD